MAGGLWSLRLNWCIRLSDVSNKILPSKLAQKFSRLTVNPNLIFLVPVGLSLPGPLLLNIKIEVMSV